MIQSGQVTPADMTNAIRVDASRRAARAAGMAGKIRQSEWGQEQAAKTEDRNLRRRRQDWQDDMAIGTQNIARENLSLRQETQEVKQFDANVASREWVSNAAKKNAAPQKGQATYEQGQLEIRAQNKNPRGDAVYYKKPGTDWFGLHDIETDEAYIIPRGMTIGGVQANPPLIIEEARKEGKSVFQWLTDHKAIQ